MPLSVTAVDRHNAGTCDHITVTIDHEGTSRTFETHYEEIDRMLPNATPLEQLEILVMLWAKYRRVNGRPILNVEIG